MSAARAEIKQAIERLSGFFAYHHKAEHAPRWTCSECQFESSEFIESHERTCSHYRRDRT